jgi:hypothetical protein
MNAYDHVASLRHQPQGNEQRTNSNPDAATISENLSDPLCVLFDRCCIIADRIKDGSIRFIDGVDLAYSAAEWSGLVDRFGDDLIQLVLADAFVGVRS